MCQRPSKEELNEQIRELSGSISSSAVEALTTDTSRLTGAKNERLSCLKTNHVFKKNFLQGIASNIYVLDSPLFFVQS